MATDQLDPAIVKLVNVRLSFPHLFIPHSMEEGQEKKYGATFLFDNTEHDALLTKLETLIDRMALDHFKKKVHFKSCLRDGNEKPDREGYGDGTMFLSAVRKTRPATVDRNANPVTDEDAIFYAGCYVNATIRLWVQDNKWGKRVNAELRAVQFAKDGDSFGVGPIDGEKEFDALGDDDGKPSSRSTRSKGKASMDDF